MNTGKIKKSIGPLAVTAFLLFTAAVCFLYLYGSRKYAGNCVAEVYQDGSLVRSVSLSRVTEPYTFDITGKNGSLNRIEVRPGSIGMIRADCPDGLCVAQGFIHSPGIPITCLPNRVVIRLRPEKLFPDKVPDAVTY